VRYSDSCLFTLATLYGENLTARQAIQTQAPVTRSGELHVGYMRETRRAKASNVIHRAKRAVPTHRRSISATGESARRSACVPPFTMRKEGQLEGRGRGVEDFPFSRVPPSRALHNRQ
jgi:hypothetical protein